MSLVERCTGQFSPQTVTHQVSQKPGVDDARKGSVTFFLDRE